MANTDKNNNNSTHLEFKAAGHKVINKLTGEVTWLAPLILADPWTKYKVDPLTAEAMREYAEVHGMDIRWTRMGSHPVYAMMVPCKKTDGHTISEEDQHILYCSLCKDEWYAQYIANKDGRCEFRDKNGKFKTCPTHINNPNYNPSGPQNPKVNPKKIANRCEHCEFNEFRQSHKVITFSDYNSDRELDFAENQSALPSVNNAGFASDAEKLLHYIISRCPKVAAVTDKLLDSPTDAKISEMAREMGIPRSTFWSQVKKIQEIAKDFWLEEYGHLPSIA